MLIAILLVVPVGVFAQQEPQSPPPSDASQQSPSAQDPPPQNATSQDPVPQDQLTQDPPPADPEAADPVPAPAVGTPKPNLAARVYDTLDREAHRYRDDSVAFFKAPLTWNSTEWKRFAGSVVIVGGLMFADKDLDRWAQRNRSSVSNRISSITTSLGADYGFYLSGALLAGGALFNHENMRETGREALEAGLVALVLDGAILKRIVGRERPAVSNGRTVFVPGSSNDSFPSGHATEAFAIASVISARSKSWPIPVVAYGLATIVAMDRINTRNHYASDVVAGALIGSSIGHFIVNRHGEQEKGVLSKASIDIVPIRHGLAARIGF
jgi:membrane-associated phospholipid phosphatase